MKRIVTGIILFLCVGVTAIVATPYLFNPNLPANGQYSSQAPQRWIYDSSGALIGTTSNQGIDNYFTLNAANTASPTALTGFGYGISSVPVVGYTATAFKVMVSGVGATSGVIALPQAPNGWACQASDQTNAASDVTVQTSDSVVSAVFQNYSRTSGTLAAWNNGDELHFQCSAY